jgi:uncharacterized protein YjbI with pentapeptide repeats
MNDAADEPSKPTSAEPGFRKISDEDLERILTDHKKWVEAKKTRLGVDHLGLRRVKVLAEDLKRIGDPKKSREARDLEALRANLPRADLRRDPREAQLQRAAPPGDLRGAQLQGADLSDAQLQGADIRWAQLQRADLSDAQLRGAALGDAQLQEALLNGAQLQGASLREAQLQGAILKGARLREAILMGATSSGWRSPRTESPDKTFPLRTLRTQISVTPT